MCICLFDLLSETVAHCLCVWVCGLVCMCACMFMCMGVCMWDRQTKHFTHKYKLIQLCRISCYCCTHTHRYVHAHTHTHTHTNAHTHTQMHTHTGLCKREKDGQTGSKKLSTNPCNVFLFTACKTPQKCIIVVYILMQCSDSSYPSLLPPLFLSLPNPFFHWQVHKQGTCKTVRHVWKNEPPQRYNVNMTV